MFSTLRLLLGTITRLFCTRRSLLLENLVLRQQLAVFKRRHPRPRLTLLDKLFGLPLAKSAPIGNSFSSSSFQRPLFAGTELVLRSIGESFPGFVDVLAEGEFRKRFGI